MKRPGSNRQSDRCGVKVVDTRPLDLQQEMLRAIPQATAAKKVGSYLSQETSQPSGHCEPDTKVEDFQHRLFPLEPTVQYDRSAFENSSRNDAPIHFEIRMHRQRAFEQDSE